MDTLPTRPIESDPIDYYRGRDFAEVCAMLDDAVDGIQLGEYDRRIVDWLKGWDSPTIVTVASLLHRARTLR